MLCPHVVEGGLQPPLRRPRAPPHPPSGARAGLSGGTSRGGAAACSCARGDTTRPSAPRPRGTAPPGSRRSAPWPPPPARPAPPGATLCAAPRPTAAADLTRTVAGPPRPRHCSAAPHHAAPAAPCPPAALLGPRQPSKHPSPAAAAAARSFSRRASRRNSAAGTSSRIGTLAPIASSPAGWTQPNHFAPCRRKSRQSQKSRPYRHDKFLQRTRRPCSSTTRSPSSLVKTPRCGGVRMSSTASEGRQSFTP